MRFILIFLFSLATMADVNKPMGLPNGFTPSPDDEISVSVIDEAKAQQLFRDFLANPPDIPFRYPQDGCYARATEMARIAEKENIQMAKIFAEGLLIAKMDYPKLPAVSWGWHVAPMVYVKKKSGLIVKMVFDPSLFDKPVSEEEWLKRMESTDDSKGYVLQGKIDKKYYGSRFQYMPKSWEENKVGWDQTDLHLVSYTFSSFRPLQFKPISKSAKTLSRTAKSAGGAQ